MRTKNNARRATLDATSALSANMASRSPPNALKSDASRDAFQDTKHSLSRRASRSARSRLLRASLSKDSMASRTFAAILTSSKSAPRTPSTAARISAPVRFSWITPASVSFCAARDAIEPSDRKTCSS